VVLHRNSANSSRERRYCGGQVVLQQPELEIGLELGLLRFVLYVVIDEVMPLTVKALLNTLGQNSRRGNVLASLSTKT